MAQTSEQQRMARLIVDVLNLEDVDPLSIDPDAIMFEEDGLGLDSIDALEIAVAIAEEYEVHLSAEDEATKQIFATLGNLTAHVAQEVNGRS
ncbi:MAG: phosphopantetheine-binding protein [Pseudomonadales bacterium]